MDISKLIGFLINRNPAVANNPVLQNYLSVIQNGNQEQGSTIAQNLCEAHGCTKEQAIEMAKQYFHIG